MNLKLKKEDTVVKLAKSDNLGRSIRQDALNALGGLPEESQHCALLAANTLKAAIRDYLAIQREPWKKAYRRY